MIIDSGDILNTTFPIKKFSVLFKNRKKKLKKVTCERENWMIDSHSNLYFLFPTAKEYFLLLVLIFHFLLDYFLCYWLLIFGPIIFFFQIFLSLCVNKTLR